MGTHSAFFVPAKYGVLPEILQPTLLSKGKSIKAVSRRLGHSNISTTLEVYAHVLPGDDLALADAVQTMYG